MFWRRKRRKENAKAPRSDKKVQIAPTIPVKLKKEIQRLGYITNRPIKDVGEILCNEGVRIPEVVDRLAQYFQKGAIRFDHVIYFGTSENFSLGDIEIEQPTDRINIRFHRSDFENIELLSYLLSTNPSRATAFLIEYSMKHPQMVDTMLTKFNRRGADEVVRGDMRKFLRYIRRDNPYKRPPWRSGIEDVAERFEPRKKSRILSMEVMEKAKDTETYIWNFGE